MELMVRSTRHLLEYQLPVPKFTITFEEEGASICKLEKVKHYEHPILSDEQVLDVGDVITLYSDNHAMLWSGTIYNSSKTECTAFDLIKRLKNPLLGTWQDMTFGNWLKVACHDCGVESGHIDNTFKSFDVIEMDGQETLSKIKTLQNEEFVYSQRRFVLHGHLGAITLKHNYNLVYNWNPNLTSLDKTRSIEETYNQIIVKQGDTAVATAQDYASIQRLGLLAKLEELEEGVDAQYMANALLEIHNTITNDVKLKLIGNPDQHLISNGFVLPIKRDEIHGLFIVKSATHTYTNYGLESEITLTSYGEGVIP